MFVERFVFRAVSATLISIERRCADAPAEICARAAGLWVPTATNDLIKRREGFSLSGSPSIAPVGPLALPCPASIASSSGPRGVIVSDRPRDPPRIRGLAATVLVSVLPKWSKLPLPPPLSPLPLSPSSLSAMLSSEPSSRSVSVRELDPLSLSA